MRLMQLQAVSQLLRELSTRHAGEKLLVYCSKLARGIFSRLGAKFEYRLEKGISQAKIFWENGVFFQFLFCLFPGRVFLSDLLQTFTSYVQSDYCLHSYKQ